MLTRIKPHYQHEGEFFVQNKRHAPPDTNEIIREIVEDNMPDEHSEFFSQLSYFGVSTMDVDGRPWATIIVGSPTTLIHAASPVNLSVSADVPEGDPFLSSIISTKDVTCRYFAGLGVDFSNRRRNKVAGFITDAHVQGTVLRMMLTTNESLGNCPKYITIRQLQYHKRNAEMEVDHRNTGNATLNEQCRAIIHRASTIFLATRHTSHVSDNTSDLGLNHRGGSPGFVRIYEENGKMFIVIPDYSGNRFYQSLGNIETDRVAGVLFPCFMTGDILHVTGIAENMYDTDAERIMPRITLITRIQLTGHVLIREALNLKLLGPEHYSPYNPPVRYLAIELEKMGKPATQVNSYEATLVGIEKLTQHTSRFTFTLEHTVIFKPEGFIILDFSHLMERTYRHMNNENPQSVNDDYVRTWTISSSPSYDPHTNTFKPAKQISCTIKHKLKGVISSLLHSYSAVGKQLPVRVQFVGVGGVFTCFDELNRTPQKLLFVAGGIGLTPFLAMHEALSQTKQRVDIVVLFACRGDEKNLLEGLIGSSIISSVSIFDSNISDAPIRSESYTICNRRMQLDDFINVSDVTNRQAFICGPAQFMIHVHQWLEKAGVDSSHIKTESFLF